MQVVGVDCDGGDMGFVDDDPDHNCSQDLGVCVGSNQTDAVVGSQLVCNSMFGSRCGEDEGIQITNGFQFFLTHVSDG